MRSAAVFGQPSDSLLRPKLLEALRRLAERETVAQLRLYIEVQSRWLARLP